MARRKGKAGRNVATYEHPDRERVNNPPVCLVTPETDRDAADKTYAHDPPPAATSMDPDRDAGTNGEAGLDRTVKVFDFFSGCGGASRGFQDAGMDVVFGLDWDADAEQSFKRNFPLTTFVSEDIRKVDEDSIRDLVDRQRPNPVLFCGCAPCQPFTRQNTTRPKPDQDERVPLLSEFLRLIRRCEPDIVFVENVPGIQNVCPDSEPLSGFLRGLKDAGFAEPTHDAVSLKRYGVPQSRRRFLLLASRHGRLNLPDETHGPGTTNPNFATVRDWIGDLPELAAGETDPEIPDHRAACLSALNLKRIRATPEGGGNRNWPEDLQLTCHQSATGYSDVYGRMSWDRPASGLTTRCISYSNGRFGHPEQHRAISVREAACLQTFPMDFRFSGSPTSRARQIGNAVPVRLATVIGHHVDRHLAETGLN